MDIDCREGRCDGDALREPGVGNAALDAKLRAGISTHITGEAAEKIPVVAMNIARQEEYEETPGP